MGRYFYIKKVFIGFIYIFPIVGLCIRFFKLLSIEKKIALFVFFFYSFFLHLFLFFPDTHISRYLIYCYTVVFFIFISSLLPKLNNLLILSLAIYIFFISFIEFQQINKYPIFNVRDSIEEMSEKNIKTFSDEVFKFLSKNGEVSKIIIGSQEVQLRGRLDNRFLIWSLDGITDSKLKNHISKNNINHFSYIKSRKLNT